LASPHPLLLAKTKKENKIWRQQQFKKAFWLAFATINYGLFIIYPPSNKVVLANRIMLSKTHIKINFFLSMS